MNRDGEASVHALRYIILSREGIMGSAGEVVLVSLSRPLGEH